MDYCGVYKIINTFTGQFYIGSAKGKFGIRTRFRNHINNLSKNKHENAKLQNSWNKYGPGCFVFVVLAKCDKDAVLKCEQFYLDTLSPYFNIAKKVSAPMYGKKHTEKARENMRNSASRYNKGISQTYEAKLKNVKSNGGSWVVCVETGQTFLGVHEAARSLGLSRQNISSVLHGRLKTTGGYRFIREEIK